MALQIDDIGISREAFTPGSVHDLNVTAFLESALERGTESDLPRNAESSLRLAPEALIPSGTFCFDNDPNFVPHAHVIMSGRVVRSATQTNRATGGTFLHAVVKTLSATIDVVAPREAAPGALREGEIVSGSFWVVGHLARRRRRWPWRRGASRSTPR
jgi:hypothetical protein